MGLDGNKQPGCLEPSLHSRTLTLARGSGVQQTTKKISLPGSCVTLLWTNILSSEGFRELSQVWMRMCELSQVWMRMCLSRSHTHHDTPGSLCVAKLSTKWEILLGFLRIIEGGPPYTCSGATEKSTVLPPPLSLEPHFPFRVGTVPLRGVGEGRAWGTVAAAGTFPGSCP